MPDPVISRTFFFNPSVLPGPWVQRLRRCLPLVALAWFLWAAGPASAQDKAPPVGVDTAQQAAIVEEVPVTGTLTSPRVAQVSTAVGGLVDAVHVEVGDRVGAGDALISLDRELQQLALAAARAATKEARARLADARRRLDEAAQLSEEKVIPASELRSLQAEVEVQGAALERLAAEEKRQAARLRRHTLQAPFAGVISRRLTEAGEWVEPGTPVAELTATDGLRIDFRVPQHYFPRIDEQTELRVTLAGAPQRRFDARIGTVVPVNDPSARTFLLRAHLDQKAVAMTPGMSAQGVLRLRTGRQGVVVPRDALMRYPDGRVTVWVVQGDGQRVTVAEQQVQTGVGFNGKVEIRQGLEAGARVVVAGNEALQQGQAVQVRAPQWASE